MITAICIVLIILSILSFSIISEARVSLNIYGKKNSIAFFLFGIKVIQIDVDFEGSDFDSFRILLKNKEKVISTINLKQIERNTVKDTFNNALPNPFYNLDIVEIDAYAEYGDDNAFRTAMIAVVLKYVFEGALLYVLSTQKVKTVSDVKANFDNRTLIFRVSSIFCITLADIIYGIIFGKKGEEKNDFGK